MAEASSSIQPMESELIHEIDESGYLISEVFTDDNEDSGKANDGVNNSIGSEEIIGKKFTTLEDAYEFYNKYALLCGFGTRIHNSHKRRGTKEIFRKEYVCNKQGFKKLNDKRVSIDDNKRRMNLRTGCEAMMRVTKTDRGNWVVDNFKDVHNHSLSVTPIKVMKHRSHSKAHLGDAFRSLVSQLNEAGLKPSQITKSMNVVTHPQLEKVTSKQVSNILRVEKQNNLGKECYCLIKHFQEKAYLDNTFYFAVDLDPEGYLRNVFWADGRSRESYTLFGDVVVFDVTYMTNKFKMPFAPFVGVNHHKQTTLFGAALLENEQEETFVWLFNQFRLCMFNKAPSAIITDQDGAICNAVAQVFPQTRHRYCAWHIKKHAIEHLQGIRARYDDFGNSYEKWIKSETVEEIENGWRELSGKYNLEEHNWLVKMYNLRKHWVKAYLKDTFFADMTTSGRSESIHSFFDGYVNANTMLNEFVMQYDKAIRCRRDAEEHEDFKTMNSKSSLSSVNPIEVKAAECYTRNVFEIFKKEWMTANSNCTHETISKNGELIKYKVGLMNVEKERWKTVDYHISPDFRATCSCAMFETQGILCKHILYIMKKKQIMDLPDYYILPRWTIDARFKVRNHIQTDDTENEVNAFVLWSIQTNCNKAIEEARDSPADLNKLNKILVNFVEDQVVRKKLRQPDIHGSEIAFIDTCRMENTSQLCIRDPEGPVKTKGRPKKANRIKSSIEMAMNNAGKKQRAEEALQNIVDL